MSDQPSRAQRIFDERFCYGMARSAEYKAGVLYILRYRFGEMPKTQHPFPAGTVQADAFYAGCEEGHDLFTAARDRAKEASHG